MTSCIFHFQCLCFSWFQLPYLLSLLYPFMVFSEIHAQKFMLSVSLLILHNQLSQTGWFKQVYFLRVLRVLSTRSSCWQVWFILRPLSLAFRWLLSHYVHTGIFLCLGLPGVSLIILAVRLNWGPILLVSA